MSPAIVTRWLIYTHRWLGLACCGLFLVWFASGIVMMYARMPRLTAEERLMRLPPLDLSAAMVPPADAARRAGYQSTTGPDRLRIGMWQGRPVYRFARGTEWRAVYADTGAPLDDVSATAAVAAVRAFMPEHAATVHHDRRLDDSDQWTLSSVIRAQMPLHRVVLGDVAGTHLYVSARTGDFVMRTDTHGRFWGYAGAVLHWVYFTPLRRQAGLWEGLIVYGSLVGCVMALSGLAAGLWRWSREPIYRLRGASGPSRSPYAGVMKWHHYGGLIFGVITFTWILSGMLSMNPWDWSPGSSPTRAQREMLAGGPLDLDRLDVAAIRTAAGALTAVFPAREVDLVQFDGAAYLSAYRPPHAADSGQWTNTDLAAYLSPQAALDRRLTRLGDPARALVDRFDQRAVERLTHRAVPGAAVVESTWLDHYDAYYYDRDGGRPLPVLRVKFDDAVNTWLYADPRSGQLVAKEERLSRLERWLYRGLHSLDFPALFFARPAWDLIVITLSLGGIAVSGTAIVLGWRRGRRWAGRTVPAARMPVRTG
jgi:hypothetical protein